MRVSVIPTDPGYRPDVAGGGYSATLDGKRVDRCVTADTDRGYVVKLCLRDGRHIVDHDDVRSTRIHGDVHIFWHGELLA